jgi:hypothetical protein
MAMLEAAKKAKGDKKPEEKKHKKKHAHPAASIPSQPEDSEDADGADTGDQDQPDAGADDSGSEGAPEGGAAPGGPPEQAQQGDGDDDQGGADAGGDQGDAQQPAQGGGAQGATPVPNPTAPGAGDTTSGGADTPTDADGDQDGDQDPNAQPPESPAENGPGGSGSESDLTQIPMSPGLKDEYEKANDMLMQLLYKSGDDKLAMGILQGLMPQGPAKIKNAAMVSLHVLVQIHKKMQLPAQLILPFAKDVAMHVMDLGQQVKQIEWSDQEATAVLGTVLESALRVFGVSKAQLQKAGHLLGKDTLMKHQQNYEAAHAHAKPAIDKNNQGWHHDHLAPQQGQPQNAGPQTGAPVGSQSAPTSNAPPTPPPPPATPEQGAAAGGMLSQAAQGAA